MIFAAGLDVTDPERSTPDQPITAFNQVDRASHIASATVRVPRQRWSLNLRGEL